VMRAACHPTVIVPFVVTLPLMQHQPEIMTMASLGTRVSSVAFSGPVTTRAT
jgi:hypothetical protein